MPRLAIAIFLLALMTLASTLSYAGFLVVGVLGEYLGTGRVVAGLLLGVLFARLPYIRERKLRTIGLLPGKARLPVMLAILAFGLLHFFYRGETLSMLFLGFTAAFLLGSQWVRRSVVKRLFSFLFQKPQEQGRARRIDESVIDVEFREKKD